MVDPGNCGYPGDSFHVCDDTADGYGVEAYEYETGQIVATGFATTRGHSSPYCSAWSSYNLPELTIVDLKGYAVKGDTIKGPWTHTTNT